MHVAPRCATHKKNEAGALMRVKLKLAGGLMLGVLLSAAGGCGGGGSSSTSTGGVSNTGTGGGSSPSGSFTVSPTTITVQASTSDAAPSGATTISVKLSASATVYAVGSWTRSGIDTVNVASSAPNTGTLQVMFKSPASLGPGTYTDTISLRMCFDTACNKPLSGGPVAITAHYTVVAVPVVSLATNQVSVAASTSDAAAPTYAVPLTISYPPAAGLFISANSSTFGITSVSAPAGATTAPHPPVTINFTAPGQLAQGTYTDQVTLTVCADLLCLQPVSGSPLYLTTTYTVTTPALPTTSQAGLSHDVVDAKYSRALDAIVMVSSYPSNALYLYDVKTQQEVSQPLNKIPTSVAVGPGGLDAAVGHDALITYVNLATLKQAAPPAPVLLNVSAEVFDLVLDGRGYVHAAPLRDQWVNFHSINIATNVEALSIGVPLRAGSHAKLQPGTTFIYSADNDLSPSSLVKWDVSSGTATYLYDLFGTNYGYCGQLWFSDDTVTTYTRCSNVFRAAATQSQDMGYSGTLPVTRGTYAYQLVSVDESAAAGAILGIEASPFDCGPTGSIAACKTNVRVYDSTFLGATGLYALPDITLAGQAYAQRGLFVFYSADGTRRFLISMLPGEADPAAQYYISAF